MVAYLRLTVGLQRLGKPKINICHKIFLTASLNIFSLFYKIFLPCSSEAVCEVEGVGEDGLHVGEVGGAVGGRGQPGRHGQPDTAAPGSIAQHTGGRT